MLYTQLTNLLVQLSNETYMGFWGNRDSYIANPHRLREETRENTEFWRHARHSVKSLPAEVPDVAWDALSAEQAKEQWEQNGSLLIYCGIPWRVPSGGSGETACWLYRDAGGDVFQNLNWVGEMSPTIGLIFGQSRRDNRKVAFFVPERPLPPLFIPTLPGVYKTRSGQEAHIKERKEMPNYDGSCWFGYVKEGPGHWIPTCWTAEGYEAELYSRWMLVEYLREFSAFD